MADAAGTWKRLRIKPDETTDDTDWQGQQISPNTITAVVGGTTTAGVYSITVTGFIVKPTGGQIDINFTATFTRAAENDNTIADELENDFDAGTANGNASTPTLASLGIVANVSSATITITAPPYAYLTFTASAPGSATITFPLGSSLPITASCPLYDRGALMNANAVVVMWNQLDVSGGTLLPGTATLSLQAIELAEVESTDSRGDRTYRYVVGALAVLTGTTPNTPYEIPLRGAKYWTIRMLTDASLTANTTDIEVLYRDAVV